METALRGKEACVAFSSLLAREINWMETSLQKYTLVELQDYSLLAREINWMET